MPDDYVKEVFYKIVNTDKESILSRHVIRMHNYFKVSYKAMLKRLIKLDLCSRDRYEELKDICLKENKEQLQALTRQEGFTIDLIVPSEVTYVPREFIERLDILELLFREIIIPQFVYDNEIKKNAGKYYGVINKAIYQERSIFKVVDRMKDNFINILARDIIED